MVGVALQAPAARGGARRATAEKREVQLLRSDGTADCDACGLPLSPFAMGRGAVHLECANRHRATTPVPRDETVRRAVEAWIARRGAQLREQHERWGTDADQEPSIS